MREIIFRGKRKDGRGWVYGAYCQKDFDGRPCIYAIDRFGGFWYVVDPETVGLSPTRKNGQKKQGKSGMN